MTDSPLLDPLRSIGFDLPSIRRILSKYPDRVVEQWADITLAALERHGQEFFTKNPQAYFLDNVQAAIRDGRTPPDWWRELRRRELALEREQERACATLLENANERDHFDDYLNGEARDAFAKVMRKLVADYRQAGQNEPSAQNNAEYAARMHFWHRFQKAYPNEAEKCHGFLPRQ